MQNHTFKIENDGQKEIKTEIELSLSNQDG